MKRSLKYILVSVLFLWLCLLAGGWMLSRPVVQTFLAGQAAKWMSDKMETRVEIGFLQIRPMRGIQLRDVFFEDAYGDTLIHAGELTIGFRFLNPFQKALKFRHLNLKDAQVFLQKKTEKDGYNIGIFARLSGPSKKEKTDTDLSIPDDWELLLEQINLETVHFRLLDFPGGLALNVQLDTGRILMDHFYPQHQELAFGAISLAGADVALSLIPNKDQDSTRVQLPTQAVSMINKWCYRLKSDELRLSRSNFQLSNLAHTPISKGIDFNYLEVEQINLHFTDVLIEGDTVFADIQELSCREKSGFEIAGMKAKAKVSTTEILCSNLALETGNSRLGPYFSMNYERFSDFGNFVSDVHIYAKLDNSSIALKDVNYFAHALDDLEHNRVLISGRVNGTIDNLKGRGLRLSIGNQTKFSGDFTLRGLPVIEETFITFKAKNIQTSFSDLRSIYPPLPEVKQLRKFGNLSFSGHFDGFYYEFVTKGLLQTGLGSLQSDLKMEFIKGGESARYSGNLTARDFDLGKWLDAGKELGKTSFTLKVDGEGFKLEDLSAQLTGSILYLEALDYSYKDVRVNGKIAESFFEGDLFVEDPNIKADFNGAVDFRDTIPVFSATLQVDHADLKALKITPKDNISFSSKMTLDFSGDKVDNIQGKILINETAIQRDDISLKLDSLILTSEFLDNNRKHFHLSTEFLEADFRGEYSFSDFGHAIKQFVQNYTSAPLFDTIRPVDPQRFQFAIWLKNSRNFLQLIDTQFYSIQNLFLSGEFNSRDNRFNLDLLIPHLHYGQFVLKDYHITSNTDSGFLDLRAELFRSFYKDSLLTEQTFISAGLHKDSLALGIALEPDTGRNMLRLNGYMVSRKDTILGKLLAKSSQLRLNHENWQFDPSNQVMFNRSFLDFKDLGISHGSQSITVNTVVRDDGIRVNELDLVQLDIYSFAQIFTTLSGFNFSGTANGKVGVSNLFKKPVVTASLKVNDLKLEDYEVGNISLISTWETGEPILNARLTVLGLENNLVINGRYHLEDAENSLDFRADIREMNIGMADVFTRDIVSDMEGSLSGALTLKGSLKKPLLTGEVSLENAAATVDFLKTRYRISQQNIVFKESWIDLGEMELTDIHNNKATAGGQIFHQNLQNFRLDVFVSTQNFLFMNTKAADNDAFYGTVFGKGTVLFTGPINNIDLYASATTMRGTQVSIPLSSGQDVERHSFFRFVNTRKDTVEEVKTYIVRKSDFRINFDLEVTPEAEVQIIFDLQDGDIIRGRGSGNLKIDFNSFGDFNIYGNYVIDQGDYLFTLQNIINKKFTVQKGGSIIWTGDPLEAKLNLNAVYRLRTAPYDLIEEIVRDFDQQVQEAKIRLPVDLFLNLTGSLLSPNIGFKINVQEASPTIASPIQTKLQLIEQNENELNKQVFGLLIFNRFLPSHTLSIAQQSQNPSLLSGVNNTVSEFLSNQLSLYLSDWLSEFVTDLNFDINFRSYEMDLGTLNPGDIASGLEQERRQELQLALSKKFYNNRLSVNVGGYFDFGGQAGRQEQSAANHIAGEFLVEYDITNDGRIRVRAFRKGDYDIFNENNRYKNGFGITYREQFDRISEIKDRRKSRLPSAPTPEEESEN